jgi:copper(I)-binding protein
MARKNFAVAALLSAAVLVLSGCATGFNAATNTQGDSGNGRSVDVGAIQIRNATVVADAADPSRATVLMTVINTDDAKDDVLNGVVVADSVSVAGEVSIPLSSKDVINVGFDSEHRIVITSVGNELKPGTYVNLSFQFASGQSVPMSLLINDKSGFYEEIEIPVPSAS